MTVPILDKVHPCHSFPGPRESVACASSDAFVQPVDVQPVESRSGTPNVNWGMKSGSSPSGSKGSPTKSGFAGESKTISMNAFPCPVSRDHHARYRATRPA